MFIVADHTCGQIGHLHLNSTRHSQKVSKRIIVRQINGRKNLPITRSIDDELVNMVEKTENSGYIVNSNVINEWRMRSLKKLEQKSIKPKYVKQSSGRTNYATPPN